MSATDRSRGTVPTGQDYVREVGNAKPEARAGGVVLAGLDAIGAVEGINPFGQ